MHPLPLPPLYWLVGVERLFIALGFFISGCAGVVSGLERKMLVDYLNRSSDINMGLGVFNPCILIQFQFPCFFLITSFHTPSMAEPRGVSGASALLAPKSFATAQEGKPIFKS